MTIETVRKRSDDRADFLICDEKDCRSTLDAKDRTFKQAVIFMRAKGWRVYKVFSTWMHACPKCEAATRKATG